LDGTSYFTNAADGLSETGPAEEVEITVHNAGCGVTTASGPIYYSLQKAIQSPLLFMPIQWALS